MQITEVNIPYSIFQDKILRAVFGRQGLFVASAGTSSLPEDSLELIYYRPLKPNLDRARQHCERNNLSLLEFHLSSGVREGNRIELRIEPAYQRWRSDCGNSDIPSAFIVFGLEGEIQGEVYHRGQFLPLDLLYLPGLYMNKVFPSGRLGMQMPDPLFLARHQRTLEAEGAASLVTSYNLNSFIVGSGGMGSTVASELPPNGFSRIAIADFDKVEESNIGRMGWVVTEADIGNYKSECVARSVSQRYGARALPLTCSIEDPQALQAIKMADVVLSCTDLETSRFITAALAALYGKVCIELSANPVGGSSGVVAAGAEVRTFIPGISCFFCCGVDFRRIRAERAGDTQGNRRGSLRFLNQSACSIGLGNLWSMIADLSIPQTRILTDTIRGTSSSRPVFKRFKCPFCSSKGLSGLGDNGLGEIYDEINPKT